MRILFIEDGTVTVKIPVLKDINPETGKVWTVEELSLIHI